MAGKLTPAVGQRASRVHCGERFAEADDHTAAPEAHQVRSTGHGIGAGTSHL